MADDAIQGYAGKWWEREPEMRIAAVFCPESARASFDAWGALLAELRTAAFELSDARVTEAKCAWWAEELAGWSAGRSRHPLGRVLAAKSVPWSALGRATLALAESEPVQPDTAAAIGALLAPANTVATVEATLFALDPARAHAAAQVIAIHWLAMRLPGGLAAADRGRVPMHLVARHGAAAFAADGGAARVALLRDWSAELLAACPAAPLRPVLRNARAAFDRARLARLARTGVASAPAPPATLWRAWRAARAASG